MFYADVENYPETFRNGINNYRVLLLAYPDILLPKLFWPIVRRNCSCDGEKVLQFEAEGREFEIFLRSLEQFVRTVEGRNNVR